MPASKSSSGGSSRSGGSKTSASRSSGRAKSSSGGASRNSSRSSGSSSRRSSGRSGAAGAQQSQAKSRRSDGGGVTDNLANFAEQLAQRVINPLGLVVLTRERIQDTLDEAAERGRLTRTDANELVGELVKRGRQQTDELLSDIERLLGRGRGHVESATKGLSDGMDRIVRTADRARRTVGVGPSFPILGYDDLTAAQVEGRLEGLTPAELRKVREYERRHANRKSVLGAIERALA
jgi:polyhydroxyalkanoate synthesis regulator phasin